MRIVVEISLALLAGLILLAPVSAITSDVAANTTTKELPYTVKNTVVLDNSMPEEFVSNVILKQRSVLIDDFHRTEIDGYDLQTVFATLVNVLESHGYVVDFASEVGFNPVNYSYVMIVDPRIPFNESEKQLLMSFLNNGGRLIMLGEWYPYSNNSMINDVSSYLGTGITFNQDEIRDNTNNDQSTNYWPIIYNFAEHPMTSGLDEIAVYAGCSLSLSENAIALASGDDDTYTVSSMAKGSVSSEGGDVEIREIIPGSPIVAAYSAVGSGDVFAIGDANIFADDIYGNIGINYYDNLKLALNVFEVPTTPTPPPTPGNATWTFMVYLDGDNNLDSAALDDLNEIMTVGSTSNVNVIVLLDRYGEGAELLYVEQGSTFELADWGEVDMGDPQTLINFVNYVVSNYPAEHYALVLWNHGGGWKKNESVLTKGVIFDDTDYDYLTMDELEYALEQIKSNIGRDLDIVGFDACLMGMAEVDYTIYKVMHTAIRIGSEECEPGDGWPYDMILSDLASNPTMTPEDLATTIVNDYLASYGSGSEVTQSAVYVNNCVYSALNDFVNAIMSANEHDAVAQAMTQVERMYCYNEYTDLYHFAELVATYTSNTTVQNYAYALMNAINDSIIAESHGSYHTNIHGISIYLPYSEIDPEYYNISFAEDNLWDEFLDWVVYWSPPEPQWTILISDSVNEAYPDISTVYVNTTADAISFKVKLNTPITELYELWGLTMLDVDQDSWTGAPQNWWGFSNVSVGAEYVVAFDYYTGYMKNDTVKHKIDEHKKVFLKNENKSVYAGLYVWNETYFMWIADISAYLNATDNSIWFSIPTSLINDSDCCMDVQQYVEGNYTTWGYDLAPDQGYAVVGEDHKPDIWADPASLSVTLPPNATYTTKITVGNDGDSILRFTSSTPAENYVVEEVSYDWIDGVTDGTPLGMGDDGYVAVTLPFNFTLYNTTFNTVYISANGYVDFVYPTPGDWTEDPIPSTDPENQMLIAVLWDDWNPSTSDGDVYVKSFDDKLVITWYNLLHYPDIGPASTFQLVLYENGTIRMNYQTVGYTDGYVVGINYGDGVHYTRYDGEIVSGMSLVFGLPVSWLSVTPNYEIALQPGEQIQLTVNINATGLDIGNHYENITIYSNDPDEEVITIPVELVVSTTPPPPENEWKVPINVTFGTESQQLAFGVNVSATEGYDFGIDSEAPPAPIDPNAPDAYFYINDLINRLYEDYRPIINQSNPEETWELKVKSPSESITITWDVSEVPLTIAELEMNNSGEIIDMKTDNSITLPPSSDYYTLFITARYDIIPPEIYNTQPTGIIANPDLPTEVTISANYSDNVGIDVSSVVLTVNGNDVTDQAVITENGISYTFMADEGTYTVYLEVSDIAGNSANTSWSFEVTPCIVTQIPLKRGWNMISLPVANATLEVPSVVSRYAYWYNPETRLYERVSINDMEAGKGYWVLAIEDCNITAAGVPLFEYRTNLTRGWNMIGALIESTDITSINVTPSNSISLRVYWYNPETHLYERSTTLEPTKGYWILAIQDCSIYVQVSPPAPPQ